MPECCTYVQLHVLNEHCSEHAKNNDTDVAKRTCLFEDGM